MDTTSTIQAASNDNEGTVSPTEPSLPSLTAAIINMALAWTVLFKRELTLAQRCFRLVLIGSVFLLVVGLSAWLSINALLLAMIQYYTNSWIAALAIVVVIQLVTLMLLLRQLQQWTHKITLPQSRAVLFHTLERVT